MQLSSSYTPWVRLWAIPPGPKKEEWGAEEHLPKKWATRVSCPFLSLSPFFSFEPIFSLFLDLRHRSDW